MVTIGEGIAIAAIWLATAGAVAYGIHVTKEPEPLLAFILAWLATMVLSAP